MTAVLSVRNLSKTFRSKGEQFNAVVNVSFDIQKGEIVSLLGPNGAGKTTTISMLTKILNPTSGMIKMKPDIKISMVFQQSILDNDLTVMENLSIRNKLW